MMLFQFGFTGVNFQKGHEFGDKKNPKFIGVNFLFFSLIWFSKSSRISRLYRVAVNDFESYEFVRSVRVAKKKAVSKARAQAKAEVRRDLEWLKRDLEKAQNDYRKLSKKVVPLKNLAFQVRNLKDFDYSELDEI